MKRKIVWVFALMLIFIFTLALGISAQSAPEDIFEFKGYSLSPSGTDLCVGYSVDYEAIEAYESEIGKSIDIGNVFASYENLNGQTPLDENGNPRVLQKGRVIKTSLNNLTYTTYDFKLTGFTKDLHTHKFVIAPFVFDGENVFYYGESGVSQSVSGASYQEIMDSVQAHTFESIVSPEFIRSSATCTEDATYYQSCSVCSMISSEWFVAQGSALGHEIVTMEEVLPTCTQAGYTECTYCSRCQVVFDVQSTIPALGHSYAVSNSLSTAPTLNSAGKRVSICSTCGDKATETVSNLVASKVTKDQVYDITTGKYNPALNNIWKVFDGNTITSDLWSAGNDWFGNIGDVLTITLDQEMYLSSLYVYVGGNYTFADIRVKNANGQVTASTSVGANEGAYGGSGTRTTVFEGKNILAYTIEVEITSLKWDSPKTFKLAEMEIYAADIDLSFDHTHVYRDFVAQPIAPTCTSEGTATYACYCKQTKDFPVPMVEHSYDTLSFAQESTCTQNGKEIYTCSCGATKEVVLETSGHIYERFVSYVTEPTISSNGSAIYQCVGCTLREEKTVPMLPLEEIKYLRVVSMNGTTVTLKFNITSDPVNYEVRYSTSDILRSNFENATVIDATVTGNGEMTVTFSLNASLNDCYYVAIRPYSGDNIGEVSAIRVGGNKLIPVIDESRIFHGEVLTSFIQLFDEQSDDYRNGTLTPSSTLSRLFNDASDTTLYDMTLSPIVDLEYMHYISNVYVYFTGAGQDIKVRWSRTPVDFQAQDSAWDGCYNFISMTGWNEVTVSSEARYIQIIFKDGNAPVEVLLYGYQCGDGNEITLEDRDLPTMGEMMGMCGFVAGGGGNTPIDSVICSTILREYHNFGWSYDFNSYMTGPSFFETSWMCNFDTQYRDYTAAGLNVVPCLQWNLSTIPVSNKVDESNMPILQDGAYVKSEFYDRFNPHTYFMYADGMFSLAARFGSNDSQELLEIANQRSKDNTQVVGLNYIKWVELGNEPDAGWFSPHEYYSAYQYAALLSAGYDGHCGTMVSSVLDNGYHFGIKNADPNMGVAMAGIAAASCNCVNAMSYWMMANRADGQVAFDAFNVHHYMAKQITLEGHNFTVGVSPEEGNLKGVMEKFVELRNKYYSDKEVWITEFGWDTNQSYSTETSAHAYGDYTGRQVQAMWLTRAYLLLSSTGVDKATMYMCEDAGIDSEVSGKYGTCGVIGYERDANGKTVEVKKDSYYYIYTLKNTLGDYAFNREISTYNENVIIYEYKTADGRTAYAAWCKTSDGTVVEDYQLRIGADGATLVEAVYGDIDGVQTQLTSDDLGYVTINISENPVYIVVD